MSGSAPPRPAADVAFRATPQPRRPLRRGPLLLPPAHPCRALRPTRESAPQRRSLDSTAEGTAAPACRSPDRTHTRRRARGPCTRTPPVRPCRNGGSARGTPRGQVMLGNVDAWGEGLRRDCHDDKLHCRSRTGPSWDGDGGRGACTDFLQRADRRHLRRRALSPRLRCATSENA